MKTLVLLLFLFPICSQAICKKQDRFTLMIHGGAGSGDKSETKRKQLLDILRNATKKGYDLLKSGQAAESVVAEVITILEDSPEFNAGRGGNPNEQGFVELDASIMRGRDKNSGAVAAVQKVKNPIQAALKVMTKSRHVMFAGPGADAFAKEQGLPRVENKYFYTGLEFENSNKAIGTVGAVALDRCGDWAAGTSTGGFKTKTPGRIGDSPIIGAGTYAENGTCAVSCTGHGEFFIRYAVAHSICSLIKYKNLSGKEAAKEVLEKQLLPAKGKGGVIIIDSKGKPAYYFTTKGMSRGVVTENGKVEVGIF